MLTTLNRLLRAPDGVTVIEYAAMAAIIAVAVATVLNTIGSQLSNTFGSVATNL